MISGVLSLGQATDGQVSLTRQPRRLADICHKLGANPRVAVLQ
jgi:hypothetical protein